MPGERKLAGAHGDIEIGAVGNPDQLQLVEEPKDGKGALPS